MRALRVALVVLAVTGIGVGCSLIVDTSGLAGGADGSAPTPIEGGEVDGTATPPGDAASEAAVVVTCPSTTDFAIDPAHCGRCGHDCMGGACESGQCRPIPLILTDNTVAGVAVDDTAIYWSLFDGTIRRAQLDGGAPRDVGKTGIGAVHIDLDATFVYVAAYDGKQIVRLRKDGSGNVETLAMCGGPCLGIAVRDGNVYFTDRGPSALRLIDSTMKLSTVVTGLTSPEDVSVTASRILIANESANTVLAVPLGGTAFSIVLTVEDPVSVTDDGNDLWVVSQRPRQILRVPVDGGAMTVTRSPGQPTGLAVSSTAVYFASGDGTVQRLAK